MMAPPFNQWLNTNLGRVMILKHSPNGRQELADFVTSGRRHFEDYEFYLTEEDISLTAIQIHKYLNCYSSEITTWQRLPVAQEASYA